MGRGVAASGAGVTVVANPRNALPGWDGSLHPVTGVVDASGSGVLAVPPETYDLVSRDAPVADILDALPGLVGRPELEAYQAIFRWSTAAGGSAGRRHLAPG